LVRLNVARLANIPKAIIDVAAVKSKELEHSIGKRRIYNLARLLGQVCHSTKDQSAIQRLLVGAEYMG
jgi:DNA mismatch repair protein MSH3